MRPSRWMVLTVVYLFYLSTLAFGAEVRKGTMEDMEWLATPYYGTVTVTSAGGHVGHPFPPLPYIDVRAYLPAGFVTDGSVDYSTQVAAMLAALDNGSSVNVTIPVGIGSTLTVSSKSRISIFGTNGGGFKVLSMPAVVTDLQSICTSCYYPVLYFKNCDRIDISGLNLDSNGINGLAGATVIVPNVILFDNVTNSVVRGNRIYGSTTETGLQVVASLRSNGNRYIGNEFTGASILLGNGTSSAGYEDNNISVVGNTFHDITHSGIQSAIQYSTIAGNTFDNSNNSINLTANTGLSKNVSITGNTFKNCATAIRNDPAGSIKTAGFTISGNVVDNCTSGITLSKAEDTVVTGNKLSVNIYGIKFDTSDNVIISSNQVSGIDDTASLGGIQTDGVCSNFLINGNYVSGFVSVATAGGIVINNDAEPSAGYTTVSNNHSFRNQLGIYVVEGTDNLVLNGNVTFNNSTADLRLNTAVQIYGSNNIYSTISNSSPPLKHKIGTKSFSYGAAAPTDATIACATGDIVWNTGTDNVIGWKCTTAGSPGTWGAMTVTIP